MLSPIRCELSFHGKKEETRQKSWRSWELILMVVGAHHGTGTEAHDNETQDIELQRGGGQSIRSCG